MTSSLHDVAGTDLNFKKNRIQDMTTLGLPYDYDGVMHYGAYAFTKNFRSPTIIKLGKGGRIGQRRGFSKTDLLQINALYDCKSESNSLKITDLSCVDIVAVA